jgi:hypothetical protein
MVKWLRRHFERQLLNEMMHPSNAVFNTVVKAKNQYKADTGEIIRTLVALVARERGIFIPWGYGAAPTSAGIYEKLPPPVGPELTMDEVLDEKNL